MKERQSNIELLRIVCMLFILVHHVITGALPLSGYAHLTGGTELLVTKLLDGLCFVAVNVFVLISGYFSIKPSWRGFFNLWFICAFYALGLYWLRLYLDGDFHIGKSALLNLLPFGRYVCWWFVGCYILLYFVSPLLNLFVERITKKEFRVALLIVTGLSWYFGFGWQSEFMNAGIYPSGYSVWHFVNIYLIGRYISKYSEDFQYSGIFWITVYIVTAFCLGLLDYFDVSVFHTNSHWIKLQDYNHPLVMMSSIALFMAFTKISFSSKLVNYLALSCLPLYLVHSHYCWMSDSYVYIANLYDSHSECFMGGVSVIFADYVLVVILLDQVRILLSKSIVSCIKKVRLMKLQ